MQDRALCFLGIAKKAGKLAIGSEAAAITARRGTARLIISADDASEGSIRRAIANARAGGAEYLPTHFTKFELGRITGRGSPGIIAILDKEMAEGFKEKVGKNGERRVMHNEYNGQVQSS